MCAGRLHIDQSVTRRFLNGCTPSRAPRLGDGPRRHRPIAEAQFAAGRHYRALHEVAFAPALRSVDPARPVIDQGRHLVEPFDDRQRDAIRRLRVIDGTLVVRLGIDVLQLLQSVLLGGRAVVGASRELGGGGKASYWRAAFRLALDEIAALLGRATKPTRRPPIPERYAVQAAVMVTAVGKGAR